MYSISTHLAFIYTPIIRISLHPGLSVNAVCFLVSKSAADWYCTERVPDCDECTTNSMEQNPSQETNSRPASQEISRHLQKSDVHYHVHKTLVKNYINP
jgi:hypothetical protein